MLRIPRYDFNEPAYETVGNYVYPISEREIEKEALGLNLSSIAFRGLNDCYTDGVEYEKADDTSALFSKTRSDILKLDKLCKSGYSTYGILVALILKNKPEKDFVSELNRNDFKIFNLQRNPYATE